LENFPQLPRLSTIIINNNRIQSIEEGLGSKIPNLETLILTNNRIENLSDVDCLKDLKKLHTVSFMKNPITRQKHYRLYVIHQIATLRTLDFQRIKQKERQEANYLFGGESGKALQVELSKKKTFVPGAAAAAGLTEEQKLKLKELLAKADTSEEVQRLQRILASGKLPKELLNNTENIEDGLEDGIVEGVDRENIKEEENVGEEEQNGELREQENGEEEQNMVEELGVDQLEYDDHQKEAGDGAVKEEEEQKQDEQEGMDTS